MRKLGTRLTTLKPSTTLAYGTTYTATVSGAKDKAGDPMSGPVTWSFATNAARGNRYMPISTTIGIAGPRRMRRR